MKRITVIILFAAAILFLFVNESCKHSPLDIGLDFPANDTTVAEPGTGPEIISDCDEDTVYFENDIYPILISNCAISGCHNAESHKDDIILSSYAELIESDIIDIDDPYDSEIIKAVSEEDAEERMPKGLPPLSDEEIDMLVTWQQQGALDNDCTDCDTAAITYTLTIVPILDAYCTGCHDETPSGMINLLNYMGTGDYAGVADVAADGRLVGAISHDPGYFAMPQGGEKLPDCYIDQIVTWVENGFPED